jgi:hypothetical protein
MRTRICDGLKKGLRELQALIHPDKFVTNPVIAIDNGEAFKTISATFSGFFQHNGNEGFYFPMEIRRLEFHIALQPLTKVSHILTFSTDKAQEEMVGITWQESALSLFHLLGKAKVNYDQRLSQWLFDHLHSVGWKNEESGIFEELLARGEDEIKFSLKAAAMMMQKLPDVHIMSSLSTEQKKLAIESIWYSRKILYKLSQSQRRVRIIIGDQSISKSTCVISLPPIFSPWNLLQHCKSMNDG